MFEIIKIKAGPQKDKWTWKLSLSAGGRLVAEAPAPFAKRSAALADIKRVKGLAASASIVEVL